MTENLIPEAKLREMLGNAFDQGGITALEATMHVLAKHRWRRRRALRVVGGLHARLVAQVASKATA